MIGKVLWILMAVIYLLFAAGDFNDYITGKRRGSGTLFFGLLFLILAIKIIMQS